MSYTSLACDTHSRILSPHTYPRTPPPAASVAVTVTRPKGFIPYFFLAGGTKPQRLPGLQIANHGQKLVFLTVIDLVDSHPPQGWCPPLRVPTFQSPKIDCTHRSLGQSHSRDLARRCTLASRSRRLFKSLAVWRHPRQLRHLLNPESTARALRPIDLHLDRRRIFETRQVPDLPFSHLLDPAGRYMLPATRANQLEPRLLPS